MNAYCARYIRKTLAAAVVLALWNCSAWAQTSKGPTMVSVPDDKEAEFNAQAQRLLPAFKHEIDTVAPCVKKAASLEIAKACLRRSNSAVAGYLGAELSMYDARIAKDTGLMTDIDARITDFERRLAQDARILQRSYSDEVKRSVEESLRNVRAQIAETRNDEALLNILKQQEDAFQRFVDSQRTAGVGYEQSSGLIRQAISTQKSMRSIVASLIADSQGRKQNFTTQLAIYRSLALALDSEAELKFVPKALFERPNRDAPSILQSTRTYEECMKSASDKTTCETYKVKP